MRWGIFVACSVLKLAFITRDGYRSTDFEVHRNWLAVTSLPIDIWYKNATESEWTLDYPPAFAYFEYLLAKVAVLVDPKMIDPKALNYASFATVIFQRCTVILSDVTLFLGLHFCGIPDVIAQASVMLHPTLLIVDHIHFQYNGLILGLLLMSVGLAEKKPHVSALLFTLLVNMKHIFIYIAPVFLIYFLRRHCMGYPTYARQFCRLVSFAAVVGSVTLLIWLPILFTGQGGDALARMFPFGRGLTHAYWASNVWALYSFVDRCAAKVIGLKVGISPTQGFAQVTNMAVLPDIKPWFTFLLAFFCYAALSYKIWRRPSHLLLHSAQASAIGFAVGWHVHEKAILMVIIPLCAYVHLPHRTAWEKKLYMVLSCYATFTCMPLLPARILETLLKWCLFGFHFLEAETLEVSMPWVVYLIPLVGHIVEYHPFGPLKAMEFLPLMLTSVVGACVILPSFYLLFRGTSAHDKRTD